MRGVRYSRAPDSRCAPVEQDVVEQDVVEQEAEEELEDGEIEEDNEGLS